MSAQIQQRFPLGNCVITPAARDHLAAAGIGAASLLARHATGDWGDVPPEDARENEYSLAHGFRIVSSYPIAGVAVWVITESDRSATTILMPQDY